MQLTQLEIKGFKSFGDKITINFNEGVTSIVGPNGCGKSNIVDAIRWVLGEQSTRLLRSEKMENIIFNGSKTRKASNLAEVSLSFDNTKNILPTEFSHVTVTRKLYRTGESEYRLNDVMCRLKDITDLFLDTGIGPDSYSIIELRMVDEIIANKEGSRRALFEEASGISKYKLRKKQTFNKLRDTETDLSRVEDLLFEIEKNLKTLESQAKKAERYYKIREQYKSMSIMLASFRISGFRDALTKLEDQEHKASVERSGITTEIDKLVAQLEALKLDNLNKEKNLSLQQKALNDFTGKIRDYENDKKIKNEQLIFLQDKEKKLKESLEAEKNQLSQIIFNQTGLREGFLREKSIFETINNDLAIQKKELDELRLKLQSSRNELDLFTHQNIDLQNRLYKAEKDLAILNIQKEALLQESKRNTEDTESRESELNGFNKIIAEIQTRLETLVKELELSQELEDKLQEDVLKTEELILSQKDLLNNESRKLDARQNEYNLTKSLVENLEGFPESIRFLKKNMEWAKQAPLFSDILFCKEEFRIAIENFLEPVMNHYVVETKTDAVQAIQLLSDSAKGRASFFILEALGKKQLRRPEISTGSNKLIPALNIIEVDTRYRPLCEYLLYNVYVLESGEDEELQNSLPDENVVVVGKSGKYIKSRISMAGGSVGLFEGKRIGRAKNLEHLSAEIRSLETDINKRKISLAQESQRLLSLKSSTKKADINTLQQEINRLNNELTSVKTRQEQYLTFIENSQNRRQDIEQKIVTITDELFNAVPRLSGLKTEKQIRENQLMANQQEYNQLSELVSDKSAEYNQENIRLHQQQNKVDGIEKDIDYSKIQQDSLDAHIAGNKKELEKTTLNIAGLLKHAGDTDEDLGAMYLNKEELEKAVREVEQEYYMSRGQINETENSISSLRRKKEQSDVITNEIKDTKNNLKLDLNTLKERLTIEFSIDISELLDAEIPAGEKEEELKYKTERIKKQLDEFGAINSMAMEAYHEMNERYSSIRDQKKDLLDARTSLLETIREIDETAQQKFMEAFIQVRENFVSVFRSLFNEEDSCDLILADPGNPLESDIDIIAKPKGKRPLSINQLSGGEKTLTATALLFSLYLLKPAPFCIFDEVDAPLDDTNIDKFNTIIRNFSAESQFIIVSHNKRTIASTDIIYGVTMIEQGISRVVAVDLREVA